MKRIKITERKLGRSKAYGFYYLGEDLIEIDPRQHSKQYLNTLCHELIHKAFPEMPEYRVSRGAGVLARGIWQQSYRRIQQ